MSAVGRCGSAARRFVSLTITPLLRAGGQIGQSALLAERCSPSKLWGMARTLAVFLGCVLLGCSSSDEASFPDQTQLDQLAGAMAFYASFEDGMDAAFARDDRRIYSAPSYEELADRGPWYWGQNVETAYDSGVSGHALSFNGELSQAVFYSADGNAPWSAGGAVSFWIQPGKYAGIPVAIVPADSGEPAVSVALTPSQMAVMVWGQEIQTSLTAMSEREWLHVAVSFASNESAEATAKLYLNGLEQGAAGDLSVEPVQSTIRLGVNYVGLIDELAIFDRALTEDEVRFLHHTPNLPASLMR